MLCNGGIDHDHPNILRGRILWQRARLPVQREREESNSICHHQPPPYMGAIPPPVVTQHPWILPFPCYSTMDHDWQQYPPSENVYTTYPPSPDESVSPLHTSSDNCNDEHLVLWNGARVSECQCSPL